jgi:hypothetical protein
MSSNPRWGWLCQKRAHPALSGETKLRHHGRFDKALICPRVNEHPEQLTNWEQV